MMARLWNWDAPVEASRAILLRRFTLWVLAFDAWLVMTPHGGRYGVGSFNVSHFAWLDAVQPVPSPNYYLATVFLSGLLALVLAIVRFNPWASALLCLVYTYSWAMSLLDSYQHHYLMSWVLLYFALWPRDLRSNAQPAGNWAFRLNVVTCAVVYFFTGVSKTEAEWVSGKALQRIAPEPLEPIVEFAAGIGVPEEVFWPMLGYSVVVLQFTVALGYLLSHFQQKHRVFRWASRATLVLALSFHIGAEYLQLRIGWFSVYMIATAIACLGPTWITNRLAAVLEWPAKWIENSFENGPGTTPVGATVQALIVAALVYGCSTMVDMPGAKPAAACFVACLVIVVAHAWWKRQNTAHLSQWTVGAAVAASLMWASVAASDARFDYYRFVGGDMKRRGQLRESLAAYEKANLYAPTGKDRKKQEAEVRARLERQNR